MALSILEKIVAEKRLEVAAKKQSLPLAALKERLPAVNATRDFASAIKGEGPKLIAEVKKASPSRGVLVKDFDPLLLATTYEKSGAAAISVLTEAAYFQGNLEYLTQIRKNVSLPLLRKDFIFSVYQVYESAVSGADALLLITSILTPEQLNQLLELSKSLGMDCLVEVYNEAELKKALESGAEIIGINNRDLNSFKTDIGSTFRLRSLVPNGKIVVSESGISSRDDVKKLRDQGIDAILVGEALVTSPDIPSRIKELMS